eukprot:m51a1_g6228 hypothetical protein (1634) ;mRNA; f:246677-252904
MGICAMLKEQGDEAHWVRANLKRFPEQAQASDDDVGDLVLDDCAAPAVPPAAATTTTATAAPGATTTTATAAAAPAAAAPVTITTPSGLTVVRSASASATSSASPRQQQQQQQTQQQGQQVAPAEHQEAVLARWLRQRHAGGLHVSRVVAAFSDECGRDLQFTPGRLLDYLASVPSLRLVGGLLVPSVASAASPGDAGALGAEGGDAEEARRQREDVERWMRERARPVLLSGLQAAFEADVGYRLRLPPGVRLRAFLGAVPSLVFLGGGGAEAVRHVTARDTPLPAAASAAPPVTAGQQQEQVTEFVQERGRVPLSRFAMAFRGAYGYWPKYDGHIRDYVLSIPGVVLVGSYPLECAVWHGDADASGDHQQQDEDEDEDGNDDEAEGEQQQQQQREPTQDEQVAQWLREQGGPVLMAKMPGLFARARGYRPQFTGKFKDYLLSIRGIAVSGTDGSDYATWVGTDSSPRGALSSSPRSATAAAAAAAAAQAPWSQAAQDEQVVAWLREQRGPMLASSFLRRWRGTFGTLLRYTGGLNNYLHSLPGVELAGYGDALTVQAAGGCGCCPPAAAARRPLSVTRRRSPAEAQQQQDDVDEPLVDYEKLREEREAAERARAEEEEAQRAHEEAERARLAAEASARAELEAKARLEALQRQREAVARAADEADYRRRAAEWQRLEAERVAREAAERRAAAVRERREQVLLAERERYARMSQLAMARQMQMMRTQQQFWRHVDDRVAQRTSEEAAAAAEEQRSREQQQQLLQEKQEKQEKQQERKSKSQKSSDSEAPKSHKKQKRLVADGMYSVLEDDQEDALEVAAPAADKHKKNGSASPAPEAPEAPAQENEGEEQDEEAAEEEEAQEEESSESAAQEEAEAAEEPAKTEDHEAGESQKEAAADAAQSHEAPAAAAAVAQESEEAEGGAEAADTAAPEADVAVEEPEHSEEEAPGEGAAQEPESAPEEPEEAVAEDADAASAAQEEEPQAHDRGEEPAAPDAAAVAAEAPSPSVSAAAVAASAVDEQPARAAAGAAVADAAPEEAGEEASQGAAEAPRERKAPAPDPEPDTVLLEVAARIRALLEETPGRAMALSAMPSEYQARFREPLDRRGRPIAEVAAMAPGVRVAGKKNKLRAVLDVPESPEERAARQERRAAESLAAGEHAAAARLLRDALESCPGDGRRADRLAMLALAQALSGDHAEARRSCEAALASDPQPSARGRAWASRALVVLGSLSQARAQAALAEGEPEAQRALADAATAQSSAERAASLASASPAAALTVAGAALAVSPGLAAAAVASAQAHASLGKHAQAIEEAAAVLAAEHAHDDDVAVRVRARLVCARSQLQSHKGSAADALAHLRKAAEADSGSAEVAELLGATEELARETAEAGRLAQAEQWPEALEAARRALAADVRACGAAGQPRDTARRVALLATASQALVALGKPEEALGVSTEAVRLTKCGNGAALRLRAAVHVALRDFKAARCDLLDALDIDPHDLDARQMARDVAKAERRSRLRSRTLYDALGVARGADEAQLRRAYKELAARWNPFRAPVEERLDAAQTFQEVSEAYSVLRDGETRAMYDRALDDGTLGDELGDDEEWADENDEEAGWRRRLRVNPQEVFSSVFGHEPQDAR